MFIRIIFLLNIISPFKHCLDLYITDSALKVVCTGTVLLYLMVLKIFPKAVGYRHL